MHLFLSPHPDDVALSCGGLLYRLAQGGAHVRVLTVMAASPPPDLPASPFVQEHIARWGLGDDPAPARRAEDRCALRALGAEVRFGKWPDALFRTDGQGRALYPDLARLFGAPHPRDPLLGALDTLIPTDAEIAALYVPLGVGGHVDHRIVRSAALRWAARRPKVAVFFYEEYPYSAAGADEVRRAQGSLQSPLLAQVFPMDEDALSTKVRAIACYRSQISTFWADVDDMARAVRAYAHQVGRAYGAERLWRLA